MNVLYMADAWNGDERERVEIRTVGDLVRFGERELLSQRNFGETSLLQVKQALKGLGLELNP